MRIEQAVIIGLILEKRVLLMIWELVSANKCSCCWFCEASRVLNSVVCWILTWLRERTMVSVVHPMRLFLEFSAVCW